MSVNLSARQLSRPELAETVEGILKETDLAGSCLILDVTETVYVTTLAGNTATLDSLRDLEARIFIDDFGVGYSSLAYLKRLPADAIKIDKSFVRGLGEDVEDTAIVRMIIELAHTLGLKVIAEGVETEEHLALLEEMGCDMAQGYHFAKPMPPEEIPALLTSAPPSKGSLSSSARPQAADSQGLRDHVGFPPHGARLARAPCRAWPTRTAGARPYGRPASSPRWRWRATRPARAPDPGRSRGTAACPGRRPRGR
jgi:hypothetical protein